MDQKNQNWAFDVVAIPQDDALQQPATTTNTTPVKVKIRMKKGDKKGVLRQGVISIPKLNPTTGYTEKVRVVHSDQTIMSFNMLMESDVNTKTYNKQHNKFFHLFKSGKCLGSQNEDGNDPPYTLATSAKSDVIKSKHLLLEENQKTKLSDINFDSKSTKTSTKAPIFLGKCKRGGCLDPPFGEDKYEYQPAAQRKQDLKDSEKCQDTNSKKISLDTLKITVKKSISVTKLECENTDIDSTLMIYKAESRKSSLLENHSDSIITYPPETSSESLGLSGKSIMRESSAVTNNSNNITDAYFMPPKIIHQKNPVRNKDNSKIDQVDEIRCFRQSKDIAVANNINISSSLQEKNNPVKGSPTYYEANGINKSDEIKSELRESINNVFDHLQQPNLKSLTKQKNSDVATTNNELIPQLVINSTDDMLVSENNTLHKYTGNITKLKTIPKFENEVDDIVKNTISENAIKSHLSKDLDTYLSPNDMVNTKGSVLEGSFNLQEIINKKILLPTDANSNNKEESICNVMNNGNIVADSDVIQKLSDYMLPQSILTESLTLHSICDNHSMQTNSDLTNKEDIIDNSFQNDFIEKQLSNSDLKPLKNDGSKQNKTNETVLITNLPDSEEKISIQPLEECNENTIQLHKSESIVSNELKHAEDLNKDEIIFNTHESYEKINEYPTEMCDDGNDDQVINNAKNIVKETDTDIGSIVNFKNDNISTAFERLQIDNDENKTSVEMDNSKSITIINNETNENNIKILNNERETLEEPENKSIDNLLITEIKDSDNLEEKSQSSDYLMYNVPVKTIESEVKHVSQIDGSPDLQKSSFLNTNSTHLFPQNNGNKDAIILPTQVIKNENIDYKVREHSIENQEVHTEKEAFLQHSNNNVFPYDTEITSTTENSPLKVLEVQNITPDHFVNDNKNNSILQSREKDASIKCYDNHLFKDNSGDQISRKEQKFKLPSNLMRDKQEISIVGSLNSSRINRENHQQPDPPNQYNEKSLTYSSEKSKDYLKTISPNTKQIPTLLKDKQLSQDPLQNVEAKTVIVDLAFQMYKNDSNETILKTLDVSREPEKLPHDSISVMKSRLNLNDNNRMSLAINSEIQLCIEINKKNYYVHPEERDLKMRESPKDGLKHDSYVEYNKRGNVRNIQLLQESLAAIYESNLVPVGKLLKNLVAEIDNISKGGVLTKKKSIAPKKFKPMKSTYSQRCKCLKK